MEKYELAILLIWKENKIWKGYPKNQTKPKQDQPPHVSNSLINMQSFKI